MSKKNSPYYHYYNNVLKGKTDNSHLIKKMTERFDIPEENIMLQDLGRHCKFLSMVICNSEVKYAIPLESKNEILQNIKNDFSTGEDLREKHQLILPPFVANKDVHRILQTDISSLLEVLEDIYCEKRFAMQITGTYTRIPEFKDYLHLIKESIESFYFNNIAAAITLLLTVIEGISREFCEVNKIYYDKNGSSSSFKAVMKNQKQNWINKVLFYSVDEVPSDYIEDETFLRRIDEGMDLLISYETYGLNFLYKSKSEYPLNRHSILHGVNKIFYTKINYYRLFMCIEALAFAVSLNPFSYNADDVVIESKLIIKFNKIKALCKLIGKMQN
ncbi:hypothetical protein ACIP9G_02835 [Lysinibacillus sp. NPDC093197]|uniref:hypothetical protein n=1 Tax=Lysinibacillus sp. NPDC093197 TaxID=3364132 RepID=UPI00382DBBB9